MSDIPRVFVSSVEKELRDERLLVQNLLNTDSFLSAHCVPVLYEFEPASPARALDECLQILKQCQACVLMVGSEGGTLVGGLSITHLEYQTAKALGMPILAFINGDRAQARSGAATALLEEIDADGLKYKRFYNIIELQTEVRRSLVKLLSDQFGVNPSSDEDRVAQQTIEATSTFESRLLTVARWQDLNHDLADQLVSAAEGRNPGDIGADGLLAGVVLRGLVWREPSSGHHYATAAGLVLLARDPSAALPQCRIQANAYAGTEADPNPRDHEDIRLPLPMAVDRAAQFVGRNTRHPMRVVGLNRVTLDEYPAEALREALVNAVAHRLYEDAGRRIMLEVFSDRVVVSSPGMPPSPITIDKLRKGKYRPCSRNPVIAQCLSYFHRIEERGSGFRRMRDAMADHGLEPPLLGSQDGYFQVTLPGPADNLDRLRVPQAGLLVTSTVEAQLSDRQKRALTEVLESGSVATGWLVRELGVVYDTANRDLKDLADRGILVRQGQGRAARYVLRERKPDGRIFR